MQEGAQEGKWNAIAQAVTWSARGDVRSACAPRVQEGKRGQRTCKRACNMSRR